MLGVLAGIVGFIPGMMSLAGAIVSKSMDVKAKIYSIKTGADRDTALAAIQAQQAADHEHTQRLMVFAGSKMLMFLLWMFAIPLIVFWWKCIVWDKVLDMGSTDPLKGQLADWANLVTQFLFGGSGALAAAQMFFNRK